MKESRIVEVGIDARARLPFESLVDRAVVVSSKGRVDVGGLKPQHVGEGLARDERDPAIEPARRRSGLGSVQENRRILATVVILVQAGAVEEVSPRELLGRPGLDDCALALTGEKVLSVAAVLDGGVEPAVRRADSDRQRRLDELLRADGEFVERYPMKILVDGRGGLAREADVFAGDVADDVRVGCGIGAREVVGVSGGEDPGEVSRDELGRELVVETARERVDFRRSGAARVPNDSEPRLPFVVQGDPGRPRIVAQLLSIPSKAGADRQCRGCGPRILNVRSELPDARGKRAGDGNPVGIDRIELVEIVGDAVFVESGHLLSAGIEPERGRRRVLVIDADLHVVRSDV